MNDKEILEAAHAWVGRYVNPRSSIFKTAEEAYLAAYHSRDKEVEQINEQNKQLFEALKKYQQVVELSLEIQGIKNRGERASNNKD